ncbi:MAG TPA: metalloregulator ArsR/SmtB family transcription factor, partial [Tepidisphaeraceae bacterium]|nr:metalloregulator ArsR/SmtB family transcription factor [Tepidisphaeraceae bacterium]
MSKLAQSDATEQDLDQLTTVFRLLSDKTRLNILMLLAGGEQNVTSLCERLKLPQPTVSHHLGLLRMNNV